MAIDKPLLDTDKLNRVLELCAETRGIAQSQSSVDSARALELVECIIWLAEEAIVNTKILEDKMREVAGYRIRANDDEITRIARRFKDLAGL